MCRYYSTQYTRIILITTIKCKVLISETNETHTNFCNIRTSCTRGSLRIISEYL